jgi:hypothetical protein
MMNKVEKLQRLSELSEELCSLPLVAAKMEPVGEEFEQASQPSPYDDWVENEPEERKASREAYRVQAGETGSEMLRAVTELRDLAHRIENLVAEARTLANGQSVASII